MPRCPGSPGIYAGECVMSGRAVGFSPPQTAHERVETRGWARGDVLPALLGGVSTIPPIPMDWRRVVSCGG